MMKTRTQIAHRVLVLFALLALTTGYVYGQEDRQGTERDRIHLGRLADGPAIIGGGIFLGEPSGVAAKLWFTETGFGADVLVAWSFANDARLYMHANGLFHLAIIETAGGRFIIPYVGAGVFSRVGSSSTLGLRIPVGLSLFPFTQLPIEFFAEVSPGLELLPGTDPAFGAGLGARFYLPL